MFARWQALRSQVSPHLDRLIGLSLALASFALYYVTLAPGVLEGDSGEWQYMANILGVPHSTGYPLYVLLAKLFTVLPVGNPAWRVNLFSAVCASLVIPLAYLLALRVSRSRAASITGAGFFAVMPTLWASATVAEVYALNSLFIALTLWFAVRFYDEGSRRDLYLMALTFGLALTNHRIAFFVAPALLVSVWLRRRSLNARVVVSGLALFLVPLLLYLYIPKRASQLLAVQSPENWSLYPRAQAILNGQVTAYYNHTPQGVFNLITALDNRNKLGFPESGGTNTLEARLATALELLREQLDPFGIALALLGIVLVLRRERALAVMLLSAGLSISMISVFLRAESTRFYFSGAYLVLVLFFAAALGAILKRLRRVPVLYALGLAWFALFPASALVLNFPRMDQSGNTRHALYARAVLDDQLAPHAVLLAPWEIATPIRYYQFVENVRPDLLVIHETPIHAKYQELMDSAQRQGRAFYYAQFLPEDKSAPGPRSIQPVAFPLPAAPQPQYPLDFKVSDAIRLVGYDWQKQIEQPDGFARLSVYYSVTAPTRKEYAAELSLADIRGVEHGTWTRRPVSEYYPTYLWQPGKFYREVWDIPLDADLPRGLYSADLTWYELDSSAGALKDETARTVNLGPLQLGDFAAPPTAHAQPVPFQNGMELLGYTVQTPGARANDSAMAGTAVLAHPGETLSVSLVWTTTVHQQASLTAFVHLVDSSGAVRAQSDRPPWGGMFPTDRWSVGEQVQDDYTLVLPGDLKLGDYRIQVGLYANPENPQPVAVAGANQVTLDTVISVVEK